MLFLLDANAIAEIVNNPAGKAAQLFRDHRSTCATSIIVACEVLYGIARKPDSKGSRRADAFLKGLTIVPLEVPADQRYGHLRAELERRGEPIGANDLLIAAHALALDCTLVTANEREFRRVPGLKVENWLR